MRWYNDAGLKQLSIEALNEEYRKVLDAIPKANPTSSIVSKTYEEDAYVGQTASSRYQKTIHHICPSDRHELLAYAYDMLVAGANIEIKNFEGDDLPSLSVRHRWPGKAPIYCVPSDYRVNFYYVLHSKWENTVPILERKYCNNESIRSIIATYYRPRKMHKFFHRFFTVLSIFAGMATFISLVLYNRHQISFDLMFPLVNGSLAVCIASYGRRVSMSTDVCGVRGTVKETNERPHFIGHILLPIALSIPAIMSIRSCCGHYNEQYDQNYRKEILRDNAVGKEANNLHCSLPKPASEGITHSRENDRERYLLALRHMSRRIGAMPVQAFPKSRVLQRKIIINA